MTRDRTNMSCLFTGPQCRGESGQCLQGVLSLHIHEMDLSKSSSIFVISTASSLVPRRACGVNWRRSLNVGSWLASRSLDVHHGLQVTLRVIGLLQRRPLASSLPSATVLASRLRPLPLCQFISRIFLQVSACVQPIEMGTLVQWEHPLKMLVRSCISSKQFPR